MREFGEFGERGEVLAQDQGPAAGGAGSPAVRLGAVSDVEERVRGDPEVSEDGPERAGVGLQRPEAFGGVDPPEAVPDPESVEPGLGSEVGDRDDRKVLAEAVEEGEDPRRETDPPDHRDQEPGLRRESLRNAALPGRVHGAAPGAAPLGPAPVPGKRPERPQALPGAARERPASCFQRDPGAEPPIRVERSVHIEGDGGEATCRNARSGPGAAYSVRENFRIICWRTSPPYTFPWVSTAMPSGPLVTGSSPGSRSETSSGR